MSIFIHSLSDVQSENIGDSTKIWQYCVVLPNARIGSGCNICSHCFIENDVLIVNNVTVKCGVQLWNGITLEDNVFIGSNVTFCNDRYPRSGNSHFLLERTLIKKGASIGANATILPGLTIGENSIIGAGSVVTKNVPADAVVIGNTIQFSQKKTAPKVSLMSLDVHGDDRGSLIALENGKNLPFNVKRVYYIFDTKTGVSRGKHAHRDLKQLLIAVSGGVKIKCEYKNKTEEFLLDHPAKGLFIEGLVWREMYDFSPDCVLAVLASEYYNEADYIRDYQTFLKEDLYG